MTKAEFTAAIKELKADLLHVISSQAGRTESKLKKEVDQRIAQAEAQLNLLKASGYPVTDEDFKQVRSQAIVDASLGVNPQAAPPAGPQQNPVVTETNNKLREMQKQYGYVLTENDPEFYEINFQNPNPEQFLAEYEAKLREAAPRAGRQLPAPSAPPGARLSSPVGSAAGSDLYAQYLKEVERAATVSERLNIRHKYRGLGLEI
jgi:hypothetical protein